MAAETESLEQHADEIAGLRGQVSMLDEYLSTGQIVSSSTAGAPSLILTDTWHDTGSLANGWSKGSGFFKYQLTSRNTVAVSVRSIVPGTDTDGTTICTGGNGLPAAYRPLNAKAVPAWTDAVRSGPAATALVFETDGSVQCYGIAVAATTTDIPYAEFPLDI